MRLEVQIEFSKNTESTLELASTVGMLDVSQPDVINDPETDLSSFVGFQLSEEVDEYVSTLDGLYGLYGTYNGVIFDNLSDANGEFHIQSDIIFNIIGRIPKYLYIMFDPVSGEYATEFTVDLILDNDLKSIQITNNTSVFRAISLEAFETARLDRTEYAYLGISIVKWSHAYKSPKIIYASDSYTAIFKNENLKNVRCSENSSNADLSLSLGIIEQFADITLYDRYGILMQLAIAGILTEKHFVNIWAENDDVNYLLGTYVTNDWDVSANSKIITLTCKDASSILDQYTVELPLDRRTAKDMLTAVFNFVPNYAYKFADTSTEQIFNNIVNTTNFFEKSSVREAVNKICNLGMANIYWSKDSFVIVT